MFDELYNDTIMDHGESSENQGELGAPALKAHAHNALCGDDLSLYAVINGSGVFEEVKWDTATDACVISRAAASMLTESLTGQSVSFAKQLAADFRSVLCGKFAGPAESLGDLMAFAPLSKNPRRVNCAAMIYAALDEIIDEYESA